jgi:hypothetical protein
MFDDPNSGNGKTEDEIALLTARVRYGKQQWKKRGYFISIFRSLL